MKVSYPVKPAVRVLSVLLCLVLLAGFFFGFDSRGAISDRNLVIGEPVPEGIIAVHNFSVPYSQMEMEAIAEETIASLPVFLTRDQSVADEVSGQIRILILAATDHENIADYFRDRVRSFYATGMVDLQELRTTFDGSRAVISGQTEENVSELFTVSEAREAMRLDLQQRGIPEEKIPQVLELIVPDLSIDTAARNDAAEEAVANLPRSMRSFETGDEILPSGGLFTSEISRYWDAMVVSPVGHQGLVEHKAAKTGLAAVLLLMGFLYMSQTSGPLAPSSFSQILLLFTAWGLTLVLTLLFAKSGVPELSYFAFTMLGAVITAVFFDSRAKNFTVPFSWMMAGIFSAIFALYSPHPMTTFFVSFIPSCFVSILIRDLSDRGIFNALSAGVVSSVLVFWLLSAAGSSGSREFTPVIWLVLVGIPLVVTGIVRVLIHPLELLFGMSTPLSYQRLQSDSHPLRMQLSSQAPGTYAHSTVVAEMAGRAAEAIGADVNLARLGGIFHDIGKLATPGMFIENMTNPDRNSPHIKMTPADSARVLINHVEEGVKLAGKHHLPSDIVDIIHQHHGDTSVRYFLEKARRELPPGAELDESVFHYANPAPRSVEAALVMLADSISSAIIGLGSGASEEERTLTVTRILRESEESGQFDDCCFSPSERRRAVSIFLDVIGSKNYERVKNFPHGK